MIGTDQGSSQTLESSVIIPEKSRERMKRDKIPAVVVPYEEGA